VGGGHADKLRRLGLYFLVPALGPRMIALERVYSPAPPNHRGHDNKARLLRAAPPTMLNDHDVSSRSAGTGEKGLAVDAMTDGKVVIQRVLCKALL